MKGRVRADAAKIVAQVAHRGRSLADLKQEIELEDGPLTWAMSYGTVRQYWRLSKVLDEMLDKPLRSNKDAELHALLLVGLYQLGHMNTPAHAAVSETVAAAPLIGRKYAKGLVNGVLRRALREDRVKQHTSVPTHPPWMVEALQQDWPEDWQRILTNNDAHPPLWLRVNRRQLTRDQYQSILTHQGLAFETHPFAPDAIKLIEPLAVAAIPGFSQGQVSVQDPAAQLAAGLMDVQPGMRVLDACAAPGGKTCHLVERYPAMGECVAVDVAAERLDKVQENLTRLKLDGVKTIRGDVASLEEVGLFDRILLDAPCTASGVIRRHPDIKLLRKKTDLDQTVQLQRDILSNLWPKLSPGSVLVYATCSVFSVENSKQIQWFIDSVSDAEVVPLENQECPWGRPLDFGRQILPGEADMDGFYYACLRKKRPKA